ncbi:uncharacterized protein LOC105214623 [Zeugodacus cucurbitae]|uniref:uncharacterized protein LOC105214623 n=1 Tax=Zeugodacus cucurbitae TaxID=28588 RepID=UPI0005968AA0|nr:uncharacterized protein LOC105214623 [Zeugodacus cucurbitae]
MDYRLRLALCCIIVVIILQLQVASANRDIELNSFQPLSEYDDSWVGWDTLRLKKKSRTELGLTGDVKIQQNLGNQQKVSLQIYKYNRESKRRGPIVFQTQEPFCELVESLQSTYDSMVEASNLPKEFECPFPKNTYTYKDYVLDTDLLVKDVPNGDYLLVAVLKNGEKAVSGIEVDLTVKN